MFGNEVVCTRDGDCVTIVINDVQAAALGAMINLACLKIDEFNHELPIEFLLEAFVLKSSLEPKLNEVLGIKC